MSAWKKGILVTAAIAGLAVFALVIRPREPVYQGRSLSDWLKDVRAPNSSIPTNSLKNLSALHAVRKIGSDGVPFLIWLLRAKDTWWKLRWNRLAQDHTAIQFQFAKAETSQELALKGLWALGSHAQPALPYLDERLLHDRSTMTGRTLGAIGRPAVPVLSNAVLHATNVETRFVALEALAWWVPTNCSDAVVPVLLDSMKTESFESLKIVAARRLAEARMYEDEVVPLLLRGMEMSENDTRADSARALLNFPDSARKHLPEIRKLAEDHDIVARNGALDVLRELSETDK